MKTSTTELLPTPILDAERSNLLQRISEEGGFAYVSVVTLAESGDLRAAEAAREMAWEQLHSGPWHSVLPVWRDAYSMACLLVAEFHHSAGDFREALRVLDMGVIMGGMLLRKDLDLAIEKIQRSTAERDFDGRMEGLSREGILDGAESSDEAEVHQALPYKSLSCKIVERRSSPSLESFLRDYFLSGSPVIISDCMSHWPARKKWKDMEYLKRVAGDRTIPVEVGKNYLYPEWKQELITFSQFLERIQSTECCSGGPTYLAQHPLFDQIQELRKDIFVPDYCCAGGGELRSFNAWFGPAGTVTPLHHDPYHNLFTQDLETRQTIGRGQEKQGLYLMDMGSTPSAFAYTLSLQNKDQVALWHSCLGRWQKVCKALFSFNNRGSIPIHRVYAKQFQSGGSGQSQCKRVSQGTRPGFHGLYLRRRRNALYSTQMVALCEISYHKFLC